MAGCWNRTENKAELWAEQRGLIVVNEPVIRRYSVWGPDSVTQLQIILQHCAVSGIACSGHFFCCLRLKSSQHFEDIICPSVCVQVAND
jgi:hypothetical protein